jgi:hypothetical protein
VLALTERDVLTAGEAEQAPETASPRTESSVETATAADNDTEPATETPFPTIDPDAGNATTTGNTTYTSD